MPFDKKATKPKLYEAIKLNKPPVKYVVDELLKDNDHEVLRLPPYHCDLNPIELIWGILKNRIALQNKTFKLDDDKTLITDNMSGITQGEWERSVQHVINTFENGRWKIISRGEAFW